MCDRPWETMTDADFEAMLARSVPDVPPEEIVAEVTPWRRAMNRILFGMALCAITLNFLCLNYILPAVGTVSPRRRSPPAEHRGRSGPAWPQSPRPSWSPTGGHTWPSPPNILRSCFFRR